MQGYLKIFVLRELVKRDMTGYELMKSFESFTGTKKPSPGTIYPLLNELMKKGMVTVSAKNNRKIYRLTKKGQKILHSLMVERKKVLENIITMCSSIYNRKEIVMMRSRMRMSLNIISGEKGHFAKDFDVLNEMRESVFALVKSKQYPKKRHEFRAIIHNTSRKIRSLMEK